MKIPISLTIFIAIILGLIFPKGTLIKDLFFPLSFILMYINVLELKLNLKHFLRKEIIFWGLINILILPLFAYFMGSFLSEYFWIGAVMAALAPAAMNSPIFVNLIEGDKELSVSISTIANLSTIFYVPVLVFILFGMKLSIPYDQILINTFGLIFIPIILAILTRKIIKEKHIKITNILKESIPILLALLLWIIFSNSASQIWSSLNEIVIVIPIIFLISAVGFLLGFLSSKKETIKRTLTIACGYKNESLMLGIIYGLNPLIAIPIVFYILAHQIFNSIIIFLFEKDKI
jgi:predicted Na+-dependent transporter